MKPLSVWLGAMFIVWSTATADTVSLNPVADTTISEGSAARADGSSPNMIVGHLEPSHANVPARGLLRFDLSSLPSSAVVTSVVLRITVANNASANTDTHVLHRLDADWLEATATWTSSGLSDWADAGGDFVPTPDASVPIDGLGTYTFAPTPSLIDTVQMWLTNAASNRGWILRSESEADGRNARRINTREAGVDQPTLIVSYTASSPPLILVQIISIELSDSNIVMTSIGTNGNGWLAFPEFSSNLVYSNWTVVPSFTNSFANGTNVTRFDRLDPICGPNVFLRMKNVRD